VHRPGSGDRGGDRAPLLTAGETRWLLVRGRGERPLDRFVRAEEIGAHGSSRRPAHEPGERAILYASVWQAIFGVVEIVGPPEHDPTKERWAWRFPIRPLVVVDDLDRAPAVEEAGIFPQSLWRHSYIRLTEEQFGAARTLVEAAGQRL
jgi:hypothetical protein